MGVGGAAACPEGGVPRGISGCWAGPPCGGPWGQEAEPGPGRPAIGWELWPRLALPAPPTPDRGLLPSAPAPLPSEARCLAPAAGFDLMAAFGLVEKEYSALRGVSMEPSAFGHAKTFTLFKEAQLTRRARCGQGGVTRAGQVQSRRRPPRPAEPPGGGGPRAQGSAPHSRAGSQPRARRLQEVMQVPLGGGRKVLVPRGGSLFPAAQGLTAPADSQAGTAKFVSAENACLLCA